MLSLAGTCCGVSGRCCLCWCVWFVVAARPKNSLLQPGMWTDTQLYAHKGKEREEPAPINTLILPEYAHSSLLPLSSLLSVFFLLLLMCAFIQVCAYRGSLHLPKASEAEKHRPCHKTHRVNSQSLLKEKIGEVPPHTHTFFWQKIVLIPRWNLIFPFS